MAVEIQFGPKYVIYEYGSEVRFEAVAAPSSGRGGGRGTGSGRAPTTPVGSMAPPTPVGVGGSTDAPQYRWEIDGEVQSETGSRLIHTFRPDVGDTLSLRRKDYRVSVTFGGETATQVLRVEQSECCGGARVAESQAGLDGVALGRGRFDDELTADEATSLLDDITDTARPVREGGSGRSYTRLLYSTQQIPGTFGVTRTIHEPESAIRRAAFIILFPLAWRPKREDFDSGIAHELEHVDHYDRRARNVEGWRELWNAGGHDVFSKFTETMACIKQIQDTNGSYRWLRRVVFPYLVNHYQDAKALLPTLGSARTIGRRKLEEAFTQATANFPELGLAAWSPYIERP